MAAAGEAVSVFGNPETVMQPFQDQLCRRTVSPGPPRGMGPATCFRFTEERHGTRHVGVELRRVEGAFRSSINEIEARAVAQAAVDFMLQHSDRSLGVVAMNQKQSILIEEYVDELARTHPHAEAYRLKWSGGLEPQPRCLGGRGMANRQRRP